MSGSCTGKKVAVVGSGITGLSAAWLLHRSGAQVTLFEKEERCGGHTLTDTSTPHPVDLGFQVYNLTTYGNLVGFFEALGVDTEPSDMSFALSVGGGAIEWGSHNLATIFAQRKNIFSPSFLRMIYDVLKFGRQAPEVMEVSKEHDWVRMTMGEYLQLRGYSDTFRSNYLLPMCAAVWSVPEAQVMAFPVQMLVRFWINHHLLDITQRPIWRVVKGRSQTYVARVLSELEDVRVSTPVVALHRPAEGQSGPVGVETAAGVEQFDAVVLAVHSDVALAILGGQASAEEVEMLRGVPYAENDVYLHTDDSLMPRTRKVWASWNFLDSATAATRAEDKAQAPVCVSYWLNSLQQLGPHAPNLFCTLNPPHPPAADKTYRHLKLAHPVYSFESVKAQEAVAGLQGRRGVCFAGAWCGYGFHEDGIKAAIAAVTALGAQVPWTPRTTSPKLGLSDWFFLTLFDKYATATITTGHLRVILPTGAELHYGDPATADPPVPQGEEWRGRLRRAAVLRVLDAAMFRKVVLRTDCGLGEAFMEGDFEVDDVAGLMAVLTANAEAAASSKGVLGLLAWASERLLYYAHRARANTIEGSRKNIEEHYDAGNAMYMTFLDASMTYSCAIHAPGRSLQDAQTAKLDAIIDRAQLGPEDHVLEIGCGWGSFAMRAVQRTGCRVTGLTLSKEQLAEATQRVKAAGLQDRVTLMFCDYRDCPGAGTFDRVVSIEMAEAVGHEHLPAYFQTIGRMLKPGGIAVIQVITIPDERYESYCGSSDFIKQHIFPGGHMPSMGAMVEAARGTGLSVQATADIGPDYAITLREWRAAWEARRADILALGYSNRFWRKYQFYFAYCEAGFDARYIRDLQITWVKAAAADGDAARGSAPQEGAVAHHLGKAVIEELPADPITQVLLAIYFFLAGAAVRSHPHLWLLPLTSALCAAALSASLTLAAALHPAFPTLAPHLRVAWGADLVQLAAALLSLAAAAGHLAASPAALALRATPTEFQSVMACTGTGFLAYQLWVWVRYRLYARRAGAAASLALHTVLLCALAVAAVKRLAIPQLPLLLLGQAPTCVHLAARLMAPADPDNALTKGLATAHRGLLVMFGIVPQAAVLLLTAAQPAAFPSRLYWALALVGILLVLASAARRLAVSFRPAPKLHAA